MLARLSKWDSPGDLTEDNVKDISATLERENGFTMQGIVDTNTIEVMKDPGGATGRAYR